MVLEVAVNGNARANPKFELRPSVRCNPLASKTKEPSHVGLNVVWLLMTRFM